MVLAHLVPSRGELSDPDSGLCLLRRELALLCSSRELSRRLTSMATPAPLAPPRDLPPRPYVLPVSFRGVEGLRPPVLIPHSGAQLATCRQEQTLTASRPCLGVGVQGGGGTTLHPSPQARPRMEVLTPAILGLTCTMSLDSGTGTRTGPVPFLTPISKGCRLEPGAASPSARASARPIITGAVPRSSGTGFPGIGQLRPGWVFFLNFC